MSDPNMNVEKLENEISDLIEKEIRDNSVILGLSIGTHGGSFIASKFKKDMDLTQKEMAAAVSSLLFLSSKMLKGSLNQEISYNLITGKKKIVISILTENIAVNSYLNRELAELEGLNKYITKLKNFALRISAFVETSDIIKEEIFVALKRAIPSGMALGIITKDGLPIKIQSNMPEPTISAMISALYNLSDVLLSEDSELEYSIIAGDNGSIILHELDEKRIIFVAVPEADESKIGSYIAKIKLIIK